MLVFVIAFHVVEVGVVEVFVFDPSGDWLVLREPLLGVVGVGSVGGVLVGGGVPEVCVGVVLVVAP